MNPSQYMAWKGMIFKSFYVSFVFAIAGELLYGTIENAKMYMIGDFIYNISTFTFTLGLMSTLFYFIFRFVINDLVLGVLSTPYSRYDASYQETVKKKRKKK